MKKYEKFVTISLFVGMLACTWILFFYARYNFMYADDYNFASQVRSIWQENGISIKNKLEGGILAAFNLMKTEWLEWSGCYTSYFFSALQPAAFADSLVFFHTIILLGTFVFCIIYFCFTFLRILFGLDKKMLGFL